MDRWKFRIATLACTWSLPFIALMLMGPLLGHHHHTDDLGDRACVVCTIAQAPGLAAQSTAAPECSHRPLERVLCQSESSLARTPAAISLSRAPPRA